jgi:heterodisulfide reductase subunit B
VRASEASIVVTNCPVCQFNLDRQQATLGKWYGDFRPLPVLYYTQLLGLALGLDGSDYGLENHYVDPRPVLSKAGLL